MFRYLKTSLILSLLVSSTSYANFCDRITEQGITFYDTPSKPDVTLVVGPGVEGRIFYSHREYPINLSCSNEVLWVTWSHGNIRGQVGGYGSDVIFTNLSGNIDGKALPFYILMTPQRPPGH
jgi:hypothetical protein